MPEPFQLPVAPVEDPLERAGNALSVLNLIQNIGDNQNSRADLAEVRRLENEKRQEDLTRMRGVQNIFRTAKPENRIKALADAGYVKEANEYGAAIDAHQKSVDAATKAELDQTAARLAASDRKFTDIGTRAVNLKYLPPDQALSGFAALQKEDPDHLGGIPFDVDENNVFDAIDHALGNNKVGSALLKDYQTAIEARNEADRKAAAETRAAATETRNVTATANTAAESATRQLEASKKDAAQAFKARWEEGQAAYTELRDGLSKELLRFFPPLYGNQAKKIVDDLAGTKAEPNLPNAVEIYNTMRRAAFENEFQDVHGRLPNDSERSADFLDFQKKLTPERLSDLDKHVAAHDGDPAMVAKYGPGLGGLMKREQAEAKDRAASSSALISAREQARYDRDNPPLKPSEVDHWVNELAIDASPATLQMLKAEGKAALRQVNDKLVENGVTIDTLTASTRTMAKTAQDLLPQFDDALKLLDDPKLQSKMGPIVGRINDFLTGKIGYGELDKDGPSFASLRATIELLKTGVLKAHFGSRGGQGLLDRFDSLAAEGKMNAETLKASLKGMRDFIDKTYVIPRYGDPTKKPAPGANPAAGGAAGAPTSQSTWQSDGTNYRFSNDGGKTWIDYKKAP